MIDEGWQYNWNTTLLLSWLLLLPTSRLLPAFPLIILNLASLLAIRHVCAVSNYVSIENWSINALDRQLLRVWVNIEAMSLIDNADFNAPEFCNSENSRLNRCTVHYTYRSCWAISSSPTHSVIYLMVAWNWSWLRSIKATKKKSRSST